MKLSECIIGTPIEVTSGFSEGTYAHIIGFAYMSMMKYELGAAGLDKRNFVIVKVRFPDGVELDINCNNLKKLVD